MTPEVANALPLIYDTALQPGRWRRALDRDAELTHAKAAALLIRHPDKSARDLQMLNSTYLDFSRSGAGIYYALRYARLQNPDWAFLGTRPVHEPTPDTAAGLTREDLDQRPDYAYLRRKIGAGQRIGVRLNRDRVWFDGLSLAGQGDSAPEIDANLAALLPHLTKAAEMGRAIHLLRRKASSASAALDRVQVGLIALLPNAEVLWANTAARRAIADSDNLSQHSDGRLRCDDADLTATLSQALATVSATARGEGTCAEHLMRIPRKSGRADYLLDIAPLRGADTEFEEDGALLTLIDPAQVPRIPIERFAHLHDLTSAEAAVCALLFEGHSLDAIAEQRARSPVTDKNQIAAILQKTGATSRADLIRLAFRVMPPIA